MPRNGYSTISTLLVLVFFIGHVLGAFSSFIRGAAKEGRKLGAKVFQANTQSPHGLGSTSSRTAAPFYGGHQHPFRSAFYPNSNLGNGPLPGIMHWARQVSHSTHTSPLAQSPAQHVVSPDTRPNTQSSRHERSDPLYRDIELADISNSSGQSPTIPTEASGISTELHADGRPSDVASRRSLATFIGSSRMHSVWGSMYQAYQSNPFSPDSTVHDYTTAMQPLYRANTQIHDESAPLQPAASQAEVMIANMRAAAKVERIDLRSAKATLRYKIQSSATGLSAFQRMLNLLPKNEHFVIEGASSASPSLQPHAGGNTNLPTIRRLRGKTFEVTLNTRGMAKCLKVLSIGANALVLYGMLSNENKTLSFNPGQSVLRSISQAPLQPLDVDSNAFGIADTQSSIHTAHTSQIEREMSLADSIPMEIDRTLQMPQDVTQHVPIDQPAAGFIPLAEPQLTNPSAHQCQDTMNVEPTTFLRPNADLDESMAVRNPLNVARSASRTKSHGIIVQTTNMASQNGNRFSVFCNQQSAQDLQFVNLLRRMCGSNIAHGQCQPIPFKGMLLGNLVPAELQQTLGHSQRIVPVTVGAIFNMMRNSALAEMAPTTTATVLLQIDLTNLQNLPRSARLMLLDMSASDEGSLVSVSANSFELNAHSSVLASNGNLTIRPINIEAGLIAFSGNLSDLSRVLGMVSEWTFIGASIGSGHARQIIVPMSNDSGSAAPSLFIGDFSAMLGASSQINDDAFAPLAIEYDAGLVYESHDASGLGDVPPAITADSGTIDRALETPMHGSAPGALQASPLAIEHFTLAPALDAQSNVHSSHPSIESTQRHLAKSAIQDGALRVSSIPSSPHLDWQSISRPVFEHADDTESELSSTGSTDDTREATPASVVANRRSFVNSSLLDLAASSRKRTAQMYAFGTRTATTFANTAVESVKRTGRGAIARVTGATRSLSHISHTARHSIQTQARSGYQHGARITSSIRSGKDAAWTLTKDAGRALTGTVRRMGIDARTAAGRRMSKGIESAQKTASNLRRAGASTQSMAIHGLHRGMERAASAASYVRNATTWENVKGTLSLKRPRTQHTENDTHAVPSDAAELLAASVARPETPKASIHPLDVVLSSEDSSSEQSTSTMKSALSNNSQEYQDTPGSVSDDTFYDADGELIDGSHESQGSELDPFDDPVHVPVIRAAIGISDSVPPHDAPAHPATAARGNSVPAPSSVSFADIYRAPRRRFLPTLQRISESNSVSSFHESDDISRNHLHRKKILKTSSSASSSFTSIYFEPETSKDNAGVISAALTVEDSASESKSDAASIKADNKDPASRIFAYGGITIGIMAACLAVASRMHVLGLFM